MSVVEIGRSFDLLLEKALLLGEAGFRVLPLKPGQKEPQFNRWQIDATADLDQINRWFDNGEQYNLGLACGPQPNGTDLVGIDIDNHGVDGRKAWQKLGEEYDMSQLRLAPQHRTPNDGFHLIVGVTESLRNSRSKIGAGIDSRGAGGFLVLPPSRIIDGNGEFRHYTAVRPLWSTPVPVMPAWLYNMLQAEPSPVPAPMPVVPAWVHDRRTLHPSMLPSGESPFDWARDHLDWPTELVAAGWRYVYERGGDSYWARPGKTDRGHSAVLHESGAFVVFSTEVPPALEGLGRRTPDGTGFSVSIGAFVAAYRFNGDVKAAARAWGEQMIQDRVSAHREPAVVEVPAPAAPTAAGAYHLPGDFYNQRPWLEHIRTAAQARMVSPDALLVTILARYAAMVPPCYRLPGIVGEQGTFDFLAAVVAETGGGKSAANGAARQLLPNPFELPDRPDEQVILMDLPVGSGEGLVQTFFVDEVDPETKKKTGKQKVGKQGAFFVVDEGAALMAMAKREGTTILPTLCSAWSGQTLGQANASMERRRIIGPGRVRVSAVINMQSSNGWRMFEDEVAVLGFPGRAMFASATDPLAPSIDDIPEWPGRLHVTHHPVVHLSNIELEYDPTIVREVRVRRSQGLVGEVTGDPLESQHLLAHCKVAGLVALLEGRQSVTPADWQLAAQIVNNSSAVVDHLRKLRTVAVERRRLAAATARGRGDAVAEDAKERAAIESLALTITRRLTAGGHHTKRSLARQVTSIKTRHRFEAALGIVIAEGRWTVNELGDISQS
jgi:hypothetical protein